MKKSIVITPVDERLELLFRHAGLSEKQAKLYRMLLITGEERASTLSRRTGIKRGNAYALLKDLAHRGLIVEFEKGKITYYRPEPPAKLLDIIATRERDVAMARELATDMVPGLTSQYKSALNRPIVKLYEGKTGLETVFRDIYGSKEGDKIVWGCADIEKVNTEFPEHLSQTLIPLRKKNQWLARSIFSDNKAGQQLQGKDTEELRESYLVDQIQFPLPAEIDIYDDKVTMLSFEEHEFMGVIIENKAFAETLRSVFKLAYQARQLQKTADPHPNPAPPSQP